MYVSKGQNVFYLFQGNEAVLGLTVPNGNIVENSPVGTTVATLGGSGGTGAASPKVYVFTVTSTVFEISGADLKLMTGASLDHETMATYTLVIT